MNPANLRTPGASALGVCQVAGILDVELALNGLHIKIRQVMKQCNESEDDYMLRHMGKLEFGK